jgi:hypothetical protein
MSAHPFPVGTPVRFVRVDVVRDVWIGDAGTVVESFAPDAGRNVRLEADGRIVNVPLVMLEEAPAEPAPDEPDYLERRLGKGHTGGDVLDWIRNGSAGSGLPLVVGSLVTVTRGMWSSMVGRIVEVRPDASGDPFYVVALLGTPDVEPLFLHVSELAPYTKATA